MQTDRQQTVLSADHRISSLVLGEWLWVGILTAASPLFTLVLACATPLVAFAALAALNMRLRSAVLLVGSVWLLNQAIGYACLGYPWSFESYAWGIALGGASYLALFVARGTANYLRTTSVMVATGGALLTAFFAFEVILFGVSYILPGGSSAFSWPVVEKVFAINVAALVGLLLLHRAALWVGLIAPARVGQSAPAVWA